MIDYADLTRRVQIRRFRRAAGQALALYGIEPVSLALLNHSFNTTFLVTEHDGARLVLHILRPIDDDLPETQRRARVESEVWWLDRVGTDLRLTVPEPVRTPDGEAVVSVGVEGIAVPLLCTLFRWVDGRMYLHGLTPQQLEAVGRLTARLHDHSAHLEIPEWFDRPGVDPADGAVEREVVPLFEEHVSSEAADVVREILRRVRVSQAELGGGPETFGVIHADIHQRNYLFSGGDVRLIDFGDCGWGHYLYDFAVTLSEIAGFPRYAELRAALLKGYREVRSLSPAHEPLIDTFIMLRELQNVTWFVKDRDDPSRLPRYLQIGDRVAALERMLGSGA